MRFPKRHETLGRAWRGGHPARVNTIRTLGNRCLPAFSLRSLRVPRPVGPALLVLALAVRWLEVSGGDAAAPAEATITVRAGEVVGPISRLLTGACLEDVNHEVYGGLYSQMIFGESFQEPAPTVPPAGFHAFGGTWRVENGELAAAGGDGPKLVSEQPAFDRGEVGVEIQFADRTTGNAGLIVKANQPGVGADNFDGYEVSLDAAAGVLRLGRHRHNWELIRDTPCDVPVGTWIPLVVKLTGQTLEIVVNGKSVVTFDDGDRALRAGAVGLRTWQCAAQYRNLWVRTGGVTTPHAFRQDAPAAFEVSGMWRGGRRTATRSRIG